MKRWKNEVPGLSQTSTSLMNGDESRRLVYRRPAGLTIRVREIDCALADIQAQIQMLRREMTYLGLVRRELAGGMEAKQRVLHSMKEQAVGRISSKPRNFADGH